MTYPLEPKHKLHYGLRIEACAAEWYQAYSPRARLVARGFRARVGEIDLIFEEPAERGAGSTELVFIEVRARQAGGLQTGVESVGGLKQARLRRAIAVFLTRYQGKARNARLDILGWDGSEWEHLKNAWDTRYQ